MKNLEKLNQLLEQEQCEFVGIEDGFTGSTADGCLRLIYLMNDCVESFLVLKNARMTGNYRKGYEGELEASLERQGKDYVLVVHQGESLFTVFFEDVLFECQLYDYGSVGHFWVKGHENLRVLEYQIAILRDKYDYLGEEFCNQEERKLAALRDFPPFMKLMTSISSSLPKRRERYQIVLVVSFCAFPSTKVKPLPQQSGLSSQAKVVSVLPPPVVAKNMTCRVRSSMLSQSSRPISLIRR